MGDGTTNSDVSDSDIISCAKQLLEAGNIESAYQLLSSFCNSEKANAEAWYLLAGTSAQLGRYQEVADACRKTIELDNNNSQARYNLGLANFKLGNFTDAISAYQAALDINPDSASTLGNLGAAWLESGKPNQAIECCKQAITLDKNLVAAINTLGIAYRESGCYRDSLEMFERGVNTNPENPEVNWNRALAYLKCGNYERGWDEFEWRWQYESSMQRESPYPRWHGIRPVAPLLVYMEQGIGDQIMFSSCLPDLLATGCKPIVECDPRLAPLFDRSFPGTITHGGSWDERLPGCQQPVKRQIPMGSLPRLFRRNIRSFPPHNGYLYAHEERVKHMHEELAQTGEAFRVGISWRGGNDDRTRCRRSIPITAMDKLGNVDSVQLVNIQYGNCEEDLRAASKVGVKVHSLSGIDAMTDLDGFAALLSALDLVITVDNSTLHLAGALGIEAWGLLPFDSDWRWLAGQDRTPWYPSVQLHHQHERNSWEHVLDRVCNKLWKRAREASSGPS